MVERYSILFQRTGDIGGIYATRINEWDLRVSTLTRFVTEGEARHEIKRVEEFQTAWAESVPDERTWARKFGTPSLLVRVDRTLIDGQSREYEFEPRPAGVGAAIRLNEQFRKNLARVSQTWPDFRVVLSGRRKDTDDSEWRQVIGLEAARGLSRNELVLVRADPQEHEFAFLESQSVAPLQFKGWKNYGVIMGLWEQMLSYEELPFDTAFVLKPLNGSKADGILFWRPDDEDKIHAKDCIRRAVTHLEKYVIQKYYPPMFSGVDDYPHMIYRDFYGLNLRTGEWESLGGFWNASPDIIIDGGSNTIFGPLLTVGPQ